MFVAILKVSGGTMLCAARACGNKFFLPPLPYHHPPNDFEFPLDKSCGLEVMSRIVA